MHNFLARANHLSALATSVLITLLCAISLSTFVLPSTPSEAALLKVSNLNVVVGRSNFEHRPREREFAFAKFDVMTDLTPLFHWNTKQVFLYLVAEYSTPTHPSNEVVIWDRIVRGSKYAKINISGGKQKYEFKEITNTFKNTTATFSLRYNVHPYVGALVSGEVIRTAAHTLPPAVRRTQ
ncbi:hypothetical protein MNV49_007589 [Pseudohyphozyma bogoriensis]|nr:hypothetical protein MNV49_007589 [Pseudohyphozyma bogoriensis]